MLSSINMHKYDCKGGGENMEKFDIYKDVAERTDGGDIYAGGVVGPVRTGKSTFIKRFMELLVLPNIETNIRRREQKMNCP